MLFLYGDLHIMHGTHNVKTGIYIVLVSVMHVQFKFYRTFGNLPSIDCVLVSVMHVQF
jgi:hypothetical protein